uniref:Uncharacterized protein n=1 Tax=Arcella intermedia TaxID=1963864 RepID=A0A6B2LW29_9EUKA
MKSFLKLFLSVVIDLIGFGTYAVPVLGEFGDIVWGPVSGWLIYLLYGSVYISMFGLAEEVLPMTDALPTATLAWAYETFLK